MKLLLGISCTFNLGSVVFTRVSLPAAQGQVLGEMGEAKNECLLHTTTGARNEVIMY